jgi:predicted amidohydrolase
MPEIKVGCVQADLVWEDPLKNHERLLNLMLQTMEQEKLDVYVLPEMFTTGFSMNVEKLGESPEGATFHWLRQFASLANALIVGSLIIKENNQYFNRLLCVFPDGGVQTYDKRHLFRMAGEHQYFQAGVKRLIVEWRGFRICPLVCYDLRFPVFSRNLLKVGQGYDLLIYLANWPARRIEHWKKLLLARAIENQAYVVGVNRVGLDGNGILYNGQSAIINPLGEYLSQPGEEIGVWAATLSFEFLENYRNHFPAFEDADMFTILE